MKNIRTGLRSAVLLLLVGLLAGMAWSAHAEDKVSEFRVGRQPGLIYLPLYVMEEQNLLPKHCIRLGIAPTNLALVSLGSASAISETLLSGSVDAVSGAIILAKKAICQR